MKKLAVAAIGALSSLTAMGQDLLQCLHPDIVNGLIFRGNSAQQMTVTAGLPESMAGYEAPAGFALIGTAERVESGSTTVAYTTELDRGEALDALLASFGAAGWELEDQQRPIPAVFQLSASPTTGMICRNGERRNLAIREIDGVRYASIDTLTQDRPLECHAEDPRLRMRPSVAGGVHDYLPSLSFPESAQAANGGSLGGGFSGAGDNTRTSARIESPDSASTLAAHLAAQMIEQGWRSDASWSGSLSTGASWTRQADDGSVVWGTLDIVKVEDSTYEVALRMLMDF